jgi:2-alkenal reductase
VISSGTGSGFVLDKDAHIVTNNHVVDGSKQIEIDFYDGTLAWADVVGVDPNSDLAVLKVDVPDDQLHPISFGDSDALQVGETVLAIGSPFGEDWTLTSGIISGLNRTIQGLNEFSIGGVIQTDAAINPGNSGGPLLNLDGQIIGVNAQIATTTESNSGVGFAIPGNLAHQVAQQLIDQGSVEYSYMGISGGDVTLALIEALNLPEDTRGVVISDVASGGPAEEAGLQDAGNAQTMDGIPANFDVITAVDNHPLRGMEDLISYLARYTTPGQTINLSVLRDGDQQITIDVRLTARP